LITIAASVNFVMFPFKFIIFNHREEDEAFDIDVSGYKPDDRLVRK
jgi:hypothetical protein